MDLVEKGVFDKMVEISDLDEKLKNKLTSDPALNTTVEKWIVKHLGTPQISSVKLCTVVPINYDSMDLAEIEDELEYKAMVKKVKRNYEVCPNHMTCPLFQAGAIVQNDKCILELMDIEYLTTGLMKELDITELEFNDKILVGQLVALNLIYTRAMRALASEPLIKEIKTISKGDLKLDTKVNDNFQVVEKTLNIMEKLRKSLILNREDKAKFKQIKKANDEMSARRKVEQTVKSFQDEIIIDGEISFDDIEA